MERSAICGKGEPEIEMQGKFFFFTILILLFLFSIGPLIAQEKYSILIGTVKGMEAKMWLEVENERLFTIPSNKDYLINQAIIV